MKFAPIALCAAALICTALPSQAKIVSGKEQARAQAERACYLDAKALCPRRHPGRGQGGGLLHGEADTAQRGLRRHLRQGDLTLHREGETAWLPCQGSPRTLFSVVPSPPSSASAARASSGFDAWCCAA